MTSQDARKYMEQAIEVMRNSVPEPRDDDKVSPTVGAVLIQSDGAIDTAFRGELREGDHAEYTVLERKNRDQKLDGSVLFATLEPCAPGARRHPKLGCAERIALARIKEVWVGIEDPDPTVGRKGIEYLRAAGATVHMFDADLQETIRQENQAFLEQALERAEAAAAEPEETVLSELENPQEDVELADFSQDALSMYKKDANVDSEIGSSAFNRRLVRQGILEKDEDGLHPTGFGFLLFGTEPRTALPQAALLVTLIRDGEEEVETFDGPLVLIPDQVLLWLRNKLPNPIDRTSARRREINDTFFVLLREGIVNALVHRDYSIEGAKSHLVVTPGSVVIRSPGLPVEPITLEQVQAFSAPMLSRNPILHYVFAQMKLAEERGLGLRSMRDRAKQAGLPMPRYTWEDPYLDLTIFRSAEAAAEASAPEVSEDLNADERAGLAFLTRRGEVTRREYQDELEFDSRKAQRHLKRFAELGLIEMRGKTKGATYRLSGT